MALIVTATRIGPSAQAMLELWQMMDLNQGILTGVEKREFEKASLALAMFERSMAAVRLARASTAFMKRAAA